MFIRLVVDLAEDLCSQRDVIFLLCPLNSIDRFVFYDTRFNAITPLEVIFHLLAHLSAELLGEHRILLCQFVRHSCRLRNLIC